MNEPTVWVRYVHNSKKIDLSYLVECFQDGRPIVREFQGEPCVRIQTMKNLYHEPEGRHIPAFTFLPVGDGLSENYTEA